MFRPFSVRTGDPSSPRSLDVMGDPEPAGAAVIRVWFRSGAVHSAEKGSKAMASKYKPDFTMPDAGPPGAFPVGAALALAGTVLLEAAMLIMLYGAYSETMGMMSDVYLCDLPGAGKLFCGIDEEMTVSHLLAFLLAVFSIAVPIAIWAEVFSRRILDDPQAWFSKPTNRAYAMIALAVYGLVFALETVNLYTLIARESAGGPFMTTVANPLMEFLSRNQGLGIFVAGLVAVVNTVLAFLTVRAAHSLKHALGGVSPWQR